MRIGLKHFMPRSLYGRAALILIVPIVTIQLIVSIAFIQRHFEGVTQQLSRGVIYEIGLIRSQLDAEGSPEVTLNRAVETARAFGMSLDLPPVPVDTEDSQRWDDLTASIVIESLRAGLSDIRYVDLASRKGFVTLGLDAERGPVRLVVERARLSASNPHQLFVIMVLASVLMTVIAYAFLRNQLRPIARLALTAEAFGKGELLPYRPRGATEVRAAGAAFLDMRARIERAIETRTLMLSGISHDLRTPLTRLRLGLSMLPEDEEVKALLSDVAEMERMVEEFLAFARGDAMEEPVLASPMTIARKVVENAARAGRHVALVEAGNEIGDMRMRPQAVSRALENLIGNGLRYGKRVELSVLATDRQLRFVVEDDGPGISESQREAAMKPFARLDDARNRNRGSGAGLGLAIVADVARSHGGTLMLGQSERLGGLRAELRLAR